MSFILYNLPFIVSSLSVTVSFNLRISLSFCSISVRYNCYVDQYTFHLFMMSCVHIIECYSHVIDRSKYNSVTPIDTWRQLIPCVRNASPFPGTHHANYWQRLNKIRRAICVKINDITSLEVCRCTMPMLVLRYWDMVALKHLDTPTSKLLK